MLEKKINDIGNFIRLGFESVVTITKVILKSRFDVKLPIAKKSRCSILGNGPSLKTSLEKDIEFIKATEITCVNNFAHSHYFDQLQPQNYALLDPAYFLFDGNS